MKNMNMTYRAESNGWVFHTISNINIFNKADFNNSFDLFWSYAKDNLFKNNTNKTFGILVKIKEENGNIRTLGPLFKFTKDDRDLLRKVILEYINIKGNSYSEFNITEVTYQYVVLGDSAKTDIPNITPKQVESIPFGDYNFPLTTNLEQWGKVTKLSRYILLVKSENYLSDIKVYIFSDKQVYHFIIDGKIIYKITDYFGKDSSNFNRVIKKSKLYVIDGKVAFKTKNKKTGFIDTIEKDKKLINNFITLDIETRVINNVHIPFCISFYDGSEAWSFYISEYSSSNDLLINALSSIMKRKYDGWNVYCHNGSGFDYIFLMGYISTLGNVKPIMKDGKFINLRLKWKKDKTEYTINFRDSLLMLPISLRKLAKAFNVESKGYFPFKFVNNFTVPLDYIRNTPDISYFTDITKDEYDTLITESWDLKKEAIKYCELDCIVLYKVLAKYNEYTFNKFSLNIHRFPTLSSLSMGTFRSDYLVDNKIPKLGGHIFDFIREGYTGGRVDVFKFYGEKLYYYDVNSLYPTVYSSKPMPVGIPSWFEGNILDYDSNAFGFFRCNITAPDNLDIPVLQTHVKTKGGIRTVAPLGTWSDVLFSEEMRMAMKYGYRFEVLEGYTFDKKVIFDKFAKDMFEIKQSHESSHPMYLISKLLLNSLYGKFGMTIDLLKHIIIDNSELLDILTNNSIVDEKDLGNGKTLISMKKERNKDSDNISMNVSIGIAAAITAYARMHMIPLLQEKGYNVYYTDTDSIVTDKPIDESLIGKELGQLKLEYIIDKGIFLAPKVYSLVTESGKVISKVKGLKKSDIAFDIFESLLVKNSSVKLPNEKWIRSLELGNVKEKHQVYELSSTENKRKIIYKNNTKFSTRPYIINVDKEII